MKALILAGGFATRLRPLSCTRPKTLFPIVNKPLLQWTFERLAENNIKQAILAVNHQTELHIKQQRIPKHGLNIKYSRDPPKTPLGTAGPIKKAEKLIGHEEPFLVLNGDIFADINYKEMLQNHKEEKATATIALHKVEDPTRYGVAEITKEKRIKKFTEKPKRGTTTTNLINAGVYVLSPTIFQHIPKARAVSMEREVFPKLAQKNALYGHVVHGLWKDIGTPEEYLQINKILLNTLTNKQKPTSTNKYELKNPVAIDKHVSIGEKSIIGPYAVIGKNVSIGKNAQIRDTIIFPNAKINDFSRINGAVIGEDTTIGKKATINKGCIIADQAKINDNVSLAKKVIICPAKQVTENILKPKIVC